MFSDSSPEVDSPWKTEFPPVASSAHAHMRSAHKIEVSCSDEQHALVASAHKSFSAQFCTPKRVPHHIGTHLWAAVTLNSSASLRVRSLTHTRTHLWAAVT